jgi:uncharacterized protein (DUF4213/DUF364 family)
MNPLQILFREFPPDFTKVKRIVAGEMYVALQLHDGNIGVCATLGYDFKINLQQLPNIDLSIPSHRILLISYYNALFNHRQDADSYGDIFDILNFSQAGSIAMIGLFRPLVRKFDQAAIPLQVFDLKQDDARLEPYSEIIKSLKYATEVLLTSTSLVNDTFSEVINYVNPGANVYMLGPSTILHEKLFEYETIKGLFGMFIPANEDRVIEVIKANGGTPEFSAFCTKVVLYR